jgi:hypothetical protein
MVEPWSAEFSARVREWCEELLVRLCLHDYPPLPEALDKAPDAEPKVPPDCGGIT